MNANEREYPQPGCNSSVKKRVLSLLYLFVPFCAFSRLIGICICLHLRSFAANISLLVICGNLRSLRIARILFAAIACGLESGSGEECGCGMPYYGE